MKQNLEFTVRKADADDALFIYTLEKKIFSSYRQKNTIEKALLDEGSMCLVAEVTGAPVGYIDAVNIYGDVEIGDFAVTDDFRNNGIGERLIGKLIENAVDRQCENIFLEVRESNSAAVHIYEKCGFECNGIRKNYYSDPTENALLYSLNIKKTGE